MTDQEMIMAQVTKALLDLKMAAHLPHGAQIVIGCSTSEIAGGRIGKASVPQIGEWVASAVLRFCQAQQLTPIFQCCEHLNRALVLSRAAAEKHGYLQVCAIPQPKAGGSVPAAAWKLLDDPCLVMAVQADAGLDIGDTLIGMHLRPVAVPFRGEITQIGHAHAVAAYSRLPYIGGERAVYKQPADAEKNL